ncbi:hypothetical protein NDU88_004768 [Pleurodeles waltl]|uniref:Uncharacterized protein n=1 Tax=Pleurodeles waltl TaxID=8319 RepID=A0AAV7W5X3_PLEWA|nr:hypothetical protein NDU88_004768 [Pleurodeles waltl]
MRIPRYQKETGAIAMVMVPNWIAGSEQEPRKEYDLSGLIWSPERSANREKICTVLSVPCHKSLRFRAIFLEPLLTKIDVPEIENEMWHTSPGHRMFYFRGLSKCF